MIQKKPITAEAVLKRMATLCARSEQCSNDIRQKLYKAGLNEQDVEQVLSQLIENKFIDDSRYAGAFSRDKARFAGWGHLKIRAALAAKKIPHDLICNAIDSISPDEFLEIAMKILASKSLNADLEKTADRARIIRHLYARGFDAGMASMAINMTRDIRRHHKES